MLSQWVVDNLFNGGVFNGKTIVPTVTITMTLPDPLYDEDIITVRSARAERCGGCTPDPQEQAALHLPVTRSCSNI